MDISGEKNSQPLKHAFRAQAQILVSNGVSLQVHTLDVSQSGIHVISPKNLPSKMTCQISFKLNLPSKKWQMCEIKAQVVQSIFSSKDGGFRIGLHFLSVPPQVENALNEFLQH